ncbi:MAG: hypothetical protein AAF004_06465 [Pseudomonadota bacterium]
MRIFVLLIVYLTAQNTAAQTVNASQRDAADQVVEEIVVRGQTAQGTVISAEEPELVLTESDIAAYGVSTIGELLQAIAAETASNAGRRDAPPVVLLNGRRISGFREIGRYPVESVLRVEVLSEAVSLSYGFAANQRVINFILKDDVKILAVETRARAPQAGGSTQLTATAQQLAISGDSRLSLDVSFIDTPAILESERADIIRPEGDMTDRAIRGDLEQWSIGTSIARAALENAIATGSASLDRSELSTLLGGNGFRQEQTTDTLDIGLSLNGPLAPTIWGATASHQRVGQVIEVFGDGGFGATQRTEQDRSLTRMDGVINTQIAGLYSSPLAVTMNAGVARERQTNCRTSLDDTARASFGRDSMEVGFSIDAAELRPRFLTGELSLNANGALRRLSDIGTLGDFGVGIAWRVNDFFQWDFTYNEQQGAPELEALSAPLVVLPNARVFDITSGASRVADVVDGGNPQLVGDARRIVQWGARVYPLGTNDLTLGIDYTLIQINNETRQFDLLTDAFERAFPERVERTGDGVLTRFDQRAVLTESTQQRTLRSSLSWSRDIAAKRRRARGPRPKRRLRSGRKGSLRIGVIHNWALKDEVTLVEGGPVLDLLNGGAISTFGGTPEHTVDVTAYRWNEGIGIYFGVSYRSATTVSSSGNTLRFDDRIVINTSFSYEFNYSGSLVARWPILEETRFVIEIGNLLNDPVKVRDDQGEVPIAFQADLLDPVERGFGIALRKRF